jgi:hypothetical protein
MGKRARVDGTENRSIRDLDQVKAMLSLLALLCSEAKTMTMNEKATCYCIVLPGYERGLVVELAFSLLA